SDTIGTSSSTRTPGGTASWVSVPAATLVRTRNAELPLTAGVVRFAIVTLPLSLGLSAAAETNSVSAVMDAVAPANAEPASTTSDVACDHVQLVGTVTAMFVTVYAESSRNENTSESSGWLVYTIAGATA